MKLKHSLFGITLALLAGSSLASSLYAQYPTPDSIKCQQRLCTDSSRPDKHVVQYTDRTGNTTLREETTFDLVACIAKTGKCVDGDRNYRGKSGHKEDIKYVVYKDFYIWPGSDGSDWAYKNETGPLFRNGTASPPASPEGYGDVVDVWCDPKGDTCDINDQKVARKDLPKFVRKAMNADNCTREFCYNDKQDVIGLNPEYMLWSK